eukprot:COSAG01_NODE_23598_length_809_cov_1.022535_1_plen_55_part_10
MKTLWCWHPRQAGWRQHTAQWRATACAHSEWGWPRAAAQPSCGLMRLLLLLLLLL